MHSLRLVGCTCISNYHLQRRFLWFIGIPHAFLFNIESSICALLFCNKNSTNWTLMLHMLVGKRLSPYGSILEKNQCFQKFLRQIFLILIHDGNRDLHFYLNKDHSSLNEINEKILIIWAHVTFEFICCFYSV